MASSPRKRASTTFTQTWNEADAAFLDPTTLPVSKAPRAWERRSETVTTRDGKQKTIWRRKASRPKTTSNTEEDLEEEEQDSRFRPVKKLQRVGPKERELGVVLPQSNRSAFKATRWDRRKSVLPRKKTTTSHFSKEIADESSYISEDVSVDIEEDDQSETEVDVAKQEPAFPLEGSFQEEERRSTFTFVADPKRRESTADQITHTADDRIDAIPVDQESIVTAQETPNEAHEDVSAQEAEEDDGVSVSESCVRANKSLSEDTALSRLSHTPADGSVERGSAQVPFEGPTLMSDARDTKYAEEASALEVATPPEEEHMAREGTNFDFETENMVEVEARSSNVDAHVASNALEPAPDSDTGHEPAPMPYKKGDMDTEMSEISLNLDIFQPEAASEAQDFEVAIDDATQDDDTLTEASLQLEMLQDWTNTTTGPISEQQITQELDISQEYKVEDSALDESNEAGRPISAIKEDPSFHVEPVSVEVEDCLTGCSIDDIADGLSLTPARSEGRGSTTRKLRSPSPPPRPESGPDDATATLYFDEDTALLKDFLSRAAASKAEKAANIVRRSSLQNRRDSDVVRQALASPRKVLEDKDPNSPSKSGNEATVELSQTLTLDVNQQPPLSPTPEPTNVEETKISKTSRRSTRTRKSRLPALSTAAQPLPGPKNIALRRTDGGEPIVLKRTEAQELGLITRSNTRKNKQGAMAVNLRLLKLNLDSMSASNQDASTSSSPILQPNRKHVQWDETLTYFQEHTDTMANVLADAASLATPDELSASIPTPTTKRKSKEPKDKNSTPRLRRVRGLGAANGTPGKGLLTQASPAESELQDEQDDAETEQQRHVPKANKLRNLAMPPSDVPSLNSPAKKAPIAILNSPIKRLTMPSLNSPAKKAPPLEIAPVGIELDLEGKVVKERKSRLATPRKVKLPQPSSTASAVPVDGKENQQSKGLGGATPKKGLRLPEVLAPAVTESGLPRRRPTRRL